MQKLFVLGGLVLLLMGWGLEAEAQRWRFVDSQYILNNMKAYNEAQKEIEEVSKKWEQEIKQRREQIRKKFQAYQSKRPLLSEKERKKMEDEIEQMEKDLAEYRSEHFGYEGKLFKLREEKMRPIHEKMLNAVKSVAKSNRVDMVVDKASQGAMLLYSKSAYDISDKVLKELGIDPSQATQPENQEQPSPEELTQPQGDNRSGGGR
jgi:outer membrane protein